MATIKKSNFQFKGRLGLNTASIVHGVKNQHFLAAHGIRNHP